MPFCVAVARSVDRRSLDTSRELDIGSIVLIVRSDIALLLAVSSSKGRLSGRVVIGSMVTGMPLILTPEADAEVRSIDTLTRTISSFAGSSAWQKRRTNREGADDPGDVGVACPTNDVHDVEGDASPCCVLT